MKIKTCELSGAALDLAVSRATAEGGNDGWGWFEISPEGFLFDPLNECIYSPSTVWKQAGPIIEREKLDVEWVTASLCRASYEWLDEDFFEGFGPTPLIAAMRCLVSKKLGPEVEIPGELL